MQYCTLYGTLTQTILGIESEHLDLSSAPTCGFHPRTTHFLIISRILQVVFVFLGTRSASAPAARSSDPYARVIQNLSVSPISCVTGHLFFQYPCVYSYCSRYDYQGVFLLIPTSSSNISCRSISCSLHKAPSPSCNLWGLIAQMRLRAPFAQRAYRMTIGCHATVNEGNLRTWAAPYRSGRISAV